MSWDRVACLELPRFIFTDRFDSPVEFFAKSLREELFNGNIKSVGKDDSESRIDVILEYVSDRITEISITKKY